MQYQINKNNKKYIIKNINTWIRQKSQGISNIKVESQTKMKS